MYKLLLVDDDKELTSLLSQLLELEGFKVETAHNGIQALNRFDSSIDLILLDIMMPELDGLNVLIELRTKFKVPVILLTAKDSAQDKITGLEYGADDYILKPFNDKELIARIKALLRRTKWDTDNGIITEQLVHYEIDKLMVNCQDRTVYFDGKFLDLTGTEFQILIKLIENAGKIITRDKLSESVLGKEFTPFTRSIDVHVSNLRKKLPLRDDGLPWIQTLRTKGYLFTGEKQNLKNRHKLFHV
ncbi:response regulator [Orbaceae bacterium ESL0721]|nr:response regulator [Orbaceae bacterium ESL0721]